MKKYILAVLPALIVAAVLFCGTSGAQTDVAADFKLEDTSDNIIALASYKEKQPVLLFFWTMSCPFCRKELKALNNRYAEFSRKGLEVLAINAGEDPDKVGRFVQANNLSYKVLLDKNINVAYSYGVFGVPTYILIDKNGYIVSRGHRFPEAEFRELITQ